MPRADPQGPKSVRSRLDHAWARTMGPMNLDRLLQHLSIDVEPFALCLLGEGWRLRLPGPPPDVLLHFVVDGTGTLLDQRDRRFPLHACSLAVVPRDLPHALECGSTIEAERVVESHPASSGLVRIQVGPADGGDLQVACGLIRASYGAFALFGHLHEVIVVDLEPFPAARAAFAGILAEQAAGAAGSTALTTALMSQCLVYLLRGLMQDVDSAPAWLTALVDPDLGGAVEAMLRAPERRHTVDSLAELASMSRSAFAARFREAFGRPPLAFLQEVRMRCAAELLTQSREARVETVARQVGFASRGRFSEAFKARYGMSPTEFRGASS